jgi:hypothetical protein
LLVGRAAACVGVQSHDRSTTAASILIVDRELSGGVEAE